MRNLEHEVEAAAQEIRPTVIHAHSPVLVGLPALRVARRLRIPMVYEVRDLWENASVDRGKFLEGSPSYRLARALDTYVLRRADGVVTICHGLHAELRKRVSDASKIEVIANGVDTETFRPVPASESIKRQWHLDGKEVILYAGTFQPYEGLDLLIRSIAKVVQFRPKAHLIIVGGSPGFAGQSLATTPDEQSLKSLVQELNLSKHVTFTGRIPHAEMIGMYALADVVVYPRRSTRTTSLTTPLKPLEAMAMANAVVVSDLPPMRELVSDGTTGLVFREGDAEDLTNKCTNLLQDAALRERLGSNARAWVLRERQWPNLIAGYSKVYESVLSRSARSAQSAPKVQVRVPAGMSK